jgi:hypothetical protein
MTPASTIIPVSWCPPNKPLLAERPVNKFISDIFLTVFKQGPHVTKIYKTGT